jgi:hypothetical protein
VSAPIKVSDRGYGKLIAKTEVDYWPAQIYRTRRGTITIEVGDHPIYGLSSEGARHLAKAITAMLDFEAELADTSKRINRLLED